MSEQQRMPMDLKVHRLTLSNAAGGALESRFQECLVEAMETCQHPDDYVGDKDGVITVKIEAAVVITCGPDGTLGIAVGADTKQPKRKRVGRPIMAQGKNVFVYDEPEQIPLAKVPSIGGGGE